MVLSEEGGGYPCPGSAQGAGGGVVKRRTPVLDLNSYAGCDDRLIR